MWLVLSNCQEFKTVNSNLQFRARSNVRNISICILLRYVGWVTRRECWHSGRRRRQVNPSLRKWLSLSLMTCPLLAPYILLNKRACLNAACPRMLTTGLINTFFRLTHTLSSFCTNNLLHNLQIWALFEILTFEYYAGSVDVTNKSNLNCLPKLFTKIKQIIHNITKTNI